MSRPPSQTREIEISHPITRLLGKISGDMFCELRHRRRAARLTTDGSCGLLVACIKMLVLIRSQDQAARGNVNQLWALDPAPCTT